jgi:hypothetical protein
MGQLPHGCAPTRYREVVLTVSNRDLLTFEAKQLRGCLLTTFGSHRATHKLPRGGSTIEAKALDTVGESEKLQSANTEPV